MESLMLSGSICLQLLVQMTRKLSSLELKKWMVESAKAYRGEGQSGICHADAYISHAYSPNGARMLHCAPR